MFDAKAHIRDSTESRLYHYRALGIDWIVLGMGREEVDGKKRIYAVSGSLREALFNCAPTGPVPRRRASAATTRSSCEAVLLS